MLPADIRPVTVRELTAGIKESLEERFAHIWVQGEVSNLRLQSSGHTYFTLKDADAQISAVLFRGDAQRQELTLRDGMEVIAFGGVSVYAPRGNYQLIVRIVLEEGLGRLQRQFETLKKKLGAEGLFAPERKKPLPEMPGTVVVITSPTGAALRDFISILQRRSWQGVVRILPVRVQGDQAAGEIVAALERANREHLGELIVLARGGGSLEDLWPFNEESLARAVAASSLPVISAVGHEIDFTLSDFAADRRAETPSAAAELISSPFVAYLERVKRAQMDLRRTLEGRLREAGHHLRILQGDLRAYAPTTRLEQEWQRQDELRHRLRMGLTDRLHRTHRTLEQLSARFHRRDPVIPLEAAHQRLSQLEKRLISASPSSALSRGYAIVRDTKGHVLDRLAGIPPNTAVNIEFKDGTDTFHRQAPHP